MIILLIFLENEIDGSTLLSDGFDDEILKELVPKIKPRIHIKTERKQLK